MRHPTIRRQNNFQEKDELEFERLRLENLRAGLVEAKARDRTPANVVATLRIACEIEAVTLNLALLQAKKDGHMALSAARAFLDQLSSMFPRHYVDQLPETVCDRNIAELELKNVTVKAKNKILILSNVIIDRFKSIEPHVARARFALPDEAQAELQGIKTLVSTSTMEIRKNLGQMEALFSAHPDIILEGMNRIALPSHVIKEVEFHTPRRTAYLRRLMFDSRA
ncbi:hypothetical protein HNP46_000161 [Pseudomonas nitritireducens]|uniref:Uncharacterized protein n=1 Tax=Pseudomonas nitroreducens TaxID=46680 RepID=A0A7W7NZJ4_PSENT|nr:hypothetical protein [Pseudomonas nitritireducens]MBB4861350.1 hypothetical protein [Pseudomonas nitritireducens]